jgi:hypothetical protein
LAEETKQWQQQDNSSSAAVAEKMVVAARRWLPLLFCSIGCWLSLVKCRVTSAFSNTKQNTWKRPRQKSSVRTTPAQRGSVFHTSIASSSTSYVGLQSKVRRDTEALLTWAKSQGVVFDNASLQSQSNGDEDVALATAHDIDCKRNNHKDNHQPPLTVLRVPSHLVLSSERICKELHADTPSTITKAEEFLMAKKAKDQLPQFFLFVKLWREYHKSENSLWYPWIACLPKSFDTAICYDDVEMECLPSHAWALASLERHHLELFRQALKLMNEGDDPDDDDLVQWIFNCVFTRCWSYPDRDRCDIVPLGDMFNHNADQTIQVDYDHDDNEDDGTGSVTFSLRHDRDHHLSAGAPLFLSYGLATNPFRFLVIFGFVDESQPEVFCQILSQEPSQRLVDMGYDSSKMVFRTKDGAVANAVWDVIMYNLLQQVPELQESFYQAHMQKDVAKKTVIHRNFHLEVAMLLHKHVHTSLLEFEKLLEKSKEYNDTAHPRLPLIRRHLKFVIGTFSKVEDNLSATIQNETKERQLLQPEKR